MRAATQDSRDAATKIARHKAVDHGVQGAVRVSQEQAVRERVRYRSPFFCEQFPSGLFVTYFPLVSDICARVHGDVIKT